MKHLIKITIQSQLAISLLFIFSQPLQAQDNDKICGAYGKVGQVMSEFILPITMENLMRFVNGVSPEMTQEIATKLASSLTEQELLAISQMSEEKRKLLFETAGSQTVKTLIEEQETTPEALGEILYQQCISEGIDALIEQEG